MQTADGRRGQRPDDADDGPAGCDALDLSQRQLTFCPPLTAYTSLTSLHLGGNKLGPSLGGAIRHLSGLTELGLERNLLRDIRGDLEGCCRLTSLDLSRNLLTSLDGVLPQCQATLRVLKLCNGFSGRKKRTLPADIIDLRCLQHLDVAFTNLSTLPGGISSLAELQAIRLGGNRITNLPTALVDGSLPELKLIDLTPWHQIASEDISGASPFIAIWETSNTTARAPALREGIPHPVTLDTGVDPSIQLQLQPLSTPSMLNRLLTSFGVDYPPGSTAEHRAQVLDRLSRCHAELGPRSEVRRTGIALPPHLADSLLEELRATQWPEVMERRSVQSGEYMTVPYLPGLGSSPLTENGQPGLHRKRSPSAVRKARRYQRLLHLADQVLGLVDPDFARRCTAIAVTKDFRGSPHIDTHDISFQWALALGSFADGGELCVETSPTQVAVIDIRGRAAKLDGRYVHWVRGYGSAERYSIIFYQTEGKGTPRAEAVYNTNMDETRCLSI